MANDFKIFESKRDVTELSKEFTRVSLQIKKYKSIYDVLDKAKSMFYILKPEQNESNAKRSQNFKSVVRQSKIWVDKCLQTMYSLSMRKRQDMKDAASRSDTFITICVKQKMTQVPLIKHANDNPCKILISIRDQPVFGID